MAPLLAFEFTTGGGQEFLESSPADLPDPVHVVSTQLLAPEHLLTVEKSLAGSNQLAPYANRVQ